MRKRERQEKILGCTLSESLILFLFILLTIANIYRKTIAEGKILMDGFKAVPGNAIIVDPSFVQIKKSEYKDIKKNEEKIEDLKESVGKKDQKIKALKKDFKKNIEPPDREENIGPI